MLPFPGLAETFNLTGDFDLNLKIGSVLFPHSYKMDIDSKVLSKEFFLLTELISFGGVLGTVVETEIFKNFYFLKRLHLGIYNLREFLHSSNNDWMLYLNAHRLTVDDSLSADPERRKIELERLSFFVIFDTYFNDYNFPAEDFCLFTRLKSENYVFTQIAHNDKLIFLPFMTCTLVRLLYYTKEWGYNLYYDQGYIANISLYDVQVRCPLVQMIENCRSSSINVEKATLLDFFYGIEMLELVGPVIIFPFISATGFFLNLIIVIVIRDKSHQKEHFKQERIFTLILINSVFNMLECLVSLLSLYGACVSYNISIFCPMVEESLTFHFVRVYTINYLSESLKTCSILTGLLFSLERYLNVIKAESKFIKKYLKFRARTLLFYILVFGFGTSFVKFLEDNSFTEMNVGWSLIQNFYMYLESWITVIHLAHYVLNDFIMVLINLVIDILLVIDIRKNLSHKKKSILKLIKENKNSARTKQKLDEIQKSHNDSNKMVIISFILFVLCRFPELAFEVHLATLRVKEDGKYYSFNCLIYNICGLLKDTTQFLYSFSYCLSIFIYYKYNKNFRSACKDQFKKIFKAKKIEN